MIWNLKLNYYNRYLKLDNFDNSTDNELILVHIYFQENMVNLPFPKLIEENLRND